jgi:hypothetical protein
MFNHLRKISRLQTRDRNLQNVFFASGREPRPLDRGGSAKIPLRILLAALLFLFFSREGKCASEYAGERIVYQISPFGRAEYNDLGTVELDGNKVDLVTFKTQVLGFSDTEKIYSAPGDLSPIRVERDVATWLGKEFLVEKYDARTFTLTIEKFKGNKKVKEYVFKKDGPIYNAILLFFYLRRVPEIDIGWTFEGRIPEKFQIQLDSIEEIDVPAGKFMAYHFKAIPDKLELWVSKDSPRTPLKIKGRGGFHYTLLMQEHTIYTAQ